ncbi:MAG: phosphoadenosine phosphosulfate reductase family protein [Proteobacteria bacterium]|nr:phosphoadenosine phosphosulfate reductase family protein [Pseudomonadota bacterium]
MYSYTYDKKTGGLLLNSSPTWFSKEPRPVYAAELDVLGFDKYWKYDKQTDCPYMWAEANHYYYRGTLVAKLKGGSVYTPPEIIIPNGEDGKPIMPEPKGISLRPVDIGAMVEANHAMLEIIEQTTVKKILAVYTKYKDRLDCFHVAFSGGKDSCVLLDLVKKALPKGSFVVVFGDTRMEFLDTYEVIEKTKQQCAEDDIPFCIAKSHLNPKESWKLFGPPSRVLRWCCSVHKSTPQTLKLREITGKDDYTGLAFVGVRAHESATRAEYEYENYGKKQKGQYSHNSILEWTSAEIWLYIYANDITLNEAYKKGSARVGCLCCPMGGGKASFTEQANYPQETEVYLSLIRSSNSRAIITAENYVANGGWNARKNGRFLTDNKPIYSESVKNAEIIIEVSFPKTDWKEWIKTLGDLSGDGDDYIIVFGGQAHSFSCKPGTKGYVVRLDEKNAKDNPLFGKLFRYAFRKAAYCLECKTCQAICKFGCLSFDDSLKIENCRHCFECHSMNAGCWAYDSLKIPKGEEQKMKTINCFSNHAPKIEWFSDFFEQKQGFLTENSLGPVQKTKFKRFLKDAELILKEEVTAFAELGSSMGWNTEAFLGLMLTNLVANNPQIEWYTQALDVGRSYRRSEIEDTLSADGQSKDNISSILNAYKRLVETPLGASLHWGFVTDQGDLVRTKCSVSDPRVVLYGLFKFAEKCNDYKEFTLATLLNDSIDRDGISPTRIFGLDREDMTPLLLGLSAKYPEFIMASFTHDLEKITLAEDKSSQEVLSLFKGDAANGQ